MPGHRRTTCGRAEKRAASAKSPTYAPIVVSVGDRFLVVEDFAEEDERCGGPWRADQEVVAIEMIREVDGYQEWCLRSDDSPGPGDWFESVGYPQLHPFQPRPRGGGLTIPRVGLGPGFKDGTTIPTAHVRGRPATTSRGRRAW